MSELPQGWVDGRIGDVTEEFSSIDPTKTPDRLFKYVDIGSIDNATQSIADPKPIVGKEAPSRARRVIRSGDVLFSTVRTYLKNIALVPGELDGELTSTGIAVLRPTAAIESLYLFKWCCSDEFVDALSSAQDGTMYPAVSDRDVGAARIPIPPLPEQKRIVAKIERFKIRIARARVELSNAARLASQFRESTLRHMFEVTEDTPTVTLGELLKDIQAGKNLRCEERPPSRGEKGVIKVSAVSSGVFKPNQAKTLPTGYLPPPEHKITEGDLLITRASGSLDLVGRVARVELDPGELYLSDKVLRLVADASVSSWLRWFLASPGAREQIESAATGISMNNITQLSLRNLVLPLPPVSKRNRLINSVESATNYVARVEAEAARAAELLNRLDQAVLTKAFRGELVPQDPTDEPASVLLERIAVNRVRVSRGNSPRMSVSRSIARAPREKAAMTKTRQDEDVKGKPYLANLLRKLGEPTSAEQLFGSAELGLVDFYKQLAWEVDNGHILSDNRDLKAA